MAQFYFLSVLLNFFAALILFYGKDLTSKITVEEKKVSKVLSTSGKRTSAKTKTEKIKNENVESKAKKAEEKVRNLFTTVKYIDSKNFRLVVGILTAFTGLMLLLSPFKGDLPVIGDFIPVLSGLAGGASILLEYYITNAKDEVNLNPTVKKIFIDSRKYLGVFCIAASLLHFIFPGIVLL